jgi:Uma2 family endonuclease
MATAQSPGEQRLRLSDVPWASYVRLREDLRQRPVRVTYDRGELEIMTLSFEHENHKHVLGILVVELAVEMNIDIAGYGSATCRREHLVRGLEGDECYWIENEPKVRGRRDIDLETDPPPDLALEIGISRIALDRLGIYAALRVPEVWCWDGSALRVLLLTAEGSYEESSRSKAFPFLPLEEFASFLRRTDVSETQLIRLFRSWVREQMARGWKPHNGAAGA